MNWASILAYIDPGTAQSFFSGLGPLLGMLAGFLLLLAWPFRYVFGQARGALPRLLGALESAWL